MTGFNVDDDSIAVSAIGDDRLFTHLLDQH